MTIKSNELNGVASYDSEIGNSLVHFFNRNVQEYPTEVGGPKFELVPVKQQKDTMLNVARMHAQQEYDRIMQVVAVLQQQAASIKRRLDITDMVYAAEYKFKPYVGANYWLIRLTTTGGTILSPMSPTDWHSSPPEHYEYITCVKWLGDFIWCEVNQDGVPIM